MAKRLLFRALLRSMLRLAGLGSRREGLRTGLDESQPVRVYRYTFEEYTLCSGVKSERRRCRHDGRKGARTRSGGVGEEK